MKKKAIYFILLISILASCKNNNSSSNISNSDSNSQPLQNSEAIKNKNSSATLYELNNDTIYIKIVFEKKDSITLRFNLEVKKNNETEKIDGLAGLIRLENEDGTFYLPEGTSILDENKKQDYLCDSTYSYQSKKISLGFGFEEKQKKRLSLTIDNSAFNLIGNQNYTLYKIN